MPDPGQLEVILRHQIYEEFWHNCQHRQYKQLHHCDITDILSIVNCLCCVIFTRK